MTGAADRRAAGYGVPVAALATNPALAFAGENETAREQRGAVGNQSLLRTRAGGAAPQRPSRMPVLQRKCACGGTCAGCSKDNALQLKAAISEPGDAFEQEADRVADQVMRMPAPSAQTGRFTPADELAPTVQRSPAPVSAGSDEALQREPATPLAPPVATPPASVCPTLPAATPATCPARNTGYCTAQGCRSANPWLGCVCVASAELCRAIDAFTGDSAEGIALHTCAALTPGASSTAIAAKGRWLGKTNQCIWGHWRAAFDAIHDSTLPIPAGLTTEWSTAVTTCRTSGVSSKKCCEAHVVGEQSAIDECGTYPSARFGKLPTDVPGAPTCSEIVRAFVPGLPFTGDFGDLPDRIAYGKKRCCP